MNTSDLMLSGTSLPDAARLPARVAGGPGGGAKRISDASVEERAGGAAAFAGHLRRIDGEASGRGTDDGAGVDESRRAGAEASERAGERASGRAPVPESGTDSAAAASVSGDEAASSAIDAANEAESASVAAPASPSASELAAAATPSGGDTGKASETLLGTGGPASDAERLPSDERLADGLATLAATEADERRADAPLVPGDGAAQGRITETPLPIDARQDEVTAAVRDAMSAGGDGAGAVSVEPSAPASALEAAAAAVDERTIDVTRGEAPSASVPAGSVGTGGVAASGALASGAAAAASAAAASARRADAATTSAAAVNAIAATDVSAAAAAAVDESRSGSAPAASAHTLSPADGEADPLSAVSSISRPGLSSLPGRTDAAASPVVPPVDAESPPAGAASGSSAAPTASSETASAARATAEGVAVSSAPALVAAGAPVAATGTSVNSPASATTVEVTLATASGAPLLVPASGTRGRAQGSDSLSGTDAGRGEAPAPVLVADVLRKRQLETTRRVEATREGIETSIASERRLGSISSEASPLANALDGDAPSTKPTTPALPGAGTAPLALAASPPGVPLATRVDLSPPPAPIAPHNVSLAGGGDATELASGVRWTLGEGRGQALVNVTPAGLGPVSIRVTLEGDQMNVSILASQAGAREALESLVPRLREQLAAEGHERVQVDVSSGRQDAQGRAGMQGQDEGGRSGTGRATGDDADTRDVESLAQQGGQAHDGTGRGGAISRSLIDAWA